MHNTSPNQAANPPAPLRGIKELSRLLAPDSIAVVGASDTAGSFGRRSMENILPGFSGRLYPVNPKRETILDVRCYPTLESLPEVPDCVVLVVPREQALDIVVRCARLGVGGIILYTSGFAETGIAERVAVQQEISRIALESGMRILGPNCVGIVNFVKDQALHFMPKFRDMPMIRGNIGLISQSGGLGYTVIQALERGVGFSHYLSAGNSCDVDVCDLINYLVEDPDTRVIACIIEGVRDGARLLEAGRRALAAGKPLLIHKMGNSEISKRTALSHTGTLAGSHAAYRAAFARVGIVAVDNWEDLLEVACLFSKTGAPVASGVGVMASSGGAAVMAADKAQEWGVDLPAPAPATVDKLSGLVPDFGSISNPTDMTAETLKSFEMYGNCIRAFVEDPGYGMVVVPMISAQHPITADRARYICELATTLDKPLCLVWLNEWLQGPGSEVYEASARVPLFRSMSRCMKAIAQWRDYHQNRARLLRPQAPALSPASCAGAALACVAAAPARVLSETQAKAVLTCYEIAVPRQGMAHSADEAVRLAEAIGYPVVMKADSQDIAHKTEAGVVKLHLDSGEAVRRAYDEIISAISRLPKGTQVAGISVQQMVRSDAEMMVGATVDPQFGPLVTCGFGGIAVEITQDVCTRLAPVGMEEAMEMIQSLRGYRLLTGFRNTPPLAVQKFAQLICKVSELIAQTGAEIAEIDVNPVLLGQDHAVAADALVVRRLPD